ncbi:MAG: hypothetical protein KC466_12785, partial [Myxococcales bacterium]|nr:hypothetical protein [Myxococcales bacterium]
MRVNASMIGPTALEGDLRRLLDGLDGWGTFQPISVRFTSRIDVADLAARHQENVDFSDDAVFVINIDPSSPEFGEAAMLDMGRGNFPLNLQDVSRDQYFRQDPRGMATNLLLESVSEDVNGNGVLDPGEDTDFDGVLDRPNILNPVTRRQCTAAEAGTPECSSLDHLVDFYEFETDTLILRPVVGLNEKTRYAVVLTKRLRGIDGEPVRSPFATINHARQNDALAALPQVLGRYGLTIDDVAFAWSFTTQSVTDELKLVVDGINGEGPFSWITDEVPPELSNIADFEVPALGLGNPRIVKFSEIDDLLNIAALLLFIGFGVTDFADIPAQVTALLDGYKSLDYL